MRLVEHTQTQQGLGGSITIGLVLEQTQPHEPLFNQLWRQVFTFERQFSRFIPESELSAFNAQAGLKQPISDAFHGILQAAQGLATQTDGLFNPFILPAIQRAGYKTSAVSAYANAPSPDYSERHVATPDKLELGPNWARIPYGTAIDLGGCGKGYLADQLGKHAREQGTHGYWIELSGDIATFGHDANGEPITIAVQAADANSAEAYTIICPAEPFGIATSGTFRRSTQTSTVAEHHIIDPRTGRPAQTNIALATVCTTSTLQADVLASCAVIVGTVEAPELLSEQQAQSWVLQTRNNSGIHSTAHGIHIHAAHKEAAHA